MRQPTSRAERIEMALNVLIRDPKILAFLSEHDPKALQRAMDAIYPPAPYLLNDKGR
jgi:hypothetical protein